MTPQELAILFLHQTHAWGENVTPETSEPNAVFVWEDLICDDPEQAWPVFEELLVRTSDDEALEQVWYRLRLLLHHHYPSFHERAAGLLARFERFAFVAGPDALDPSRYEESPFDREALINAYRIIHRTAETVHAFERLIHADPERALTVAVEIIHRGIARGWSSFDVMSPLGDVLDKKGEELVSLVEERAKESVAVRRVLWRLRSQHKPWTAELRDRLQKATGATTDYTDRDVPVPAPQTQLAADERLVGAWFQYEKNFWAFSALNDLCDEDPRLAWDITLELIAHADDDSEIYTIAAGPLEDLIRKRSDVIWADVVTEAHKDSRFRTALGGVWVFEEDGDVYHRYQELMQTIDAEPN
jgi:hypothetical protein